MGGIPLECRNAIIHINTRTKMAEFDKYQKLYGRKIAKDIPLRMCFAFSHKSIRVFKTRILYEMCHKNFREES